MTPPSKPSPSRHFRAPAAAFAGRLRRAAAVGFGLAFFLCWLGAMPLTCLAEQNFLLKGFSLGGTDKQPEVNLRLAVSEEHNLAYMLRDGAKMEMTCHVQFLRKRTFWSNELLAENTVSTRLAYDRLLREFVLSAEDAPLMRNESFRRLMSESWENLCIPLDNPGGLEQDQSYLVKVTADLKYTEMPPWLTRSILFWSEEIIPATTFELDLTY